MSSGLSDNSVKQLTTVLEEFHAAVGQLSRDVATLARKHAALAAGQALRDTGRQPRYPVEFRSQFGEDVFLWELFAGQTQGFFIEVGAFDGFSYSVSYAFECIGWEGLLIEPIPERAEACRNRRTASRVVNAALSRAGVEGDVEFTVVDDQFGGMLSYLTTSPDHIEAINRNRQASRRARVPMTYMDAVLEQETRRIDFAVLDVEGGELELLHGFDLRARRPRVLVIEDHVVAPTSPLTAYMGQQPYREACWVGGNRVYIHNDEAELLARAKYR